MILGILGIGLSSASAARGQNAQCTITSGQNFGKILPYQADPAPPMNAPCQVGSYSGFISRTSSGIGVNANSVCTIAVSGHTVDAPYEGNPVPALRTPCKVGDITGYISRTSANVTAPPPPGGSGNRPPQPGTCIQGFVWRLADSTDHVCVTPQTRSQAAADNAAQGRKNANGTCIQGFVWRLADSTDHVCVTPQIRAQTAADNSAAPSRIGAFAL